MTDDDLPTNTANPHHSPTNKGEFPKTADEWKPGDLADGISPSDVSEGEWVDSRGYPYNPETGSKSPQGGRCNAPVDNYEERYGERRYCGQLPVSHFKNDVDHDYCRKHKGRANIDVRAEELLQHGMSARTRDHVYRKLPDWQRLYIYGLHETLMAFSVHEYSPEYELKEFDFGDAPFSPNVEGQDGPVYKIHVPHATENLDREVALWAASVDGVKLELANAQIAVDEMSVEKTEHAQLTAPPSEHDNSPQEWRTIETLVEHPLNTAYSRLVKDRKELLKYGGIAVEGELSNDDTAVRSLESLTVVQADTQDETPTADKARDAGLEVGVED